MPHSGSVTFAGVTLSAATPELQAFCDRFIPLPPASWQFAQRRRPPSTFPLLTFPPPPPLPKVQLGTLYWPTGASRWGVYYGVAGKDQVQAMRDACYGTSGDLTNLSGKLKFKGLDGTQDELVPSIVQVTMYMLPPRPLSSRPGKNNPYLVTLVDERYWWQFRTGGDMTLEDAGEWDSFFTTMKELLDVADARWVCDPVDEDYLFPDPLLSESNNQTLPLLLDAACWNVGRRLVIDPDTFSGTDFVADGAVTVMDVAASKTRLAANMELAKRLGGGYFDFDGKGGARDDAAFLPAVVRLVFPNTDCGTRPYDLDVAVPDVPGYEDVDGMGTWTFFDQVLAEGTPPANLTALTALAQAFAQDFLDYQSQANHDVALAGVVAWQPEGLTDCIEWTVAKDEDEELVPDDKTGAARVRKRVLSVARTRAARPPWNAWPEDLLHGDGGNLSSGSGAGFEVTRCLTLNATECIDGEDVTTTYTINFPDAVRVKTEQG